MAKRARTVVRSAKTGRFVKKDAAKYNPSTTVKEKVRVGAHSVTVARNTETGRFVKKKSLKRRSAKIVADKIKR